MIKLWLVNDLGNQLFALFSIMAYALEHDIGFKIITYHDRNMSGNKVYWKNILSSFQGNINKYVYRKQSEYITDEFYENNDLKFFKLPEYLKNKSYIIQSNFYSYKYFDNYLPQILKYTKIEPHRIKVKEEYPDLFTKKNIAIHFCMEDYISIQNTFCIQKPEFYIHSIKNLEKDLSLIGESLENYNFLYFCSEKDNERVEQFMKVIRCITKYNYNFIKIQNDIDDWKQFLLMTSCSHFIISNTKFAWMAGIK